MTKIKICGLSEPETLTTAIEDGADFIGLVFCEPSPRNIEIEVAKYLAKFIPNTLQTVGLFVEPSDEQLNNILNEVPLNMIQLHGNESPERVTEIKAKFKLPVMKAIPISSSDDLKLIEQYEDTADWLLFDAKGEKIPGGNGIAFNWNILKNYQGAKPWMLAGGLTPDNVIEALSILSPNAVDVSSGVESNKGIKDMNKIRSFLRAVKQA